MGDGRHRGPSARVAVRFTLTLTLADAERSQRSMRVDSLNCQSADRYDGRLHRAHRPLRR